jgi:hypothetical protein
MVSLRDLNVERVGTTAPESKEPERKTLAKAALSGLGRYALGQPQGPPLKKIRNREKTKTDKNIVDQA